MIGKQYKTRFYVSLIFIFPAFILFQCQVETKVNDKQLKKDLDFEKSELGKLLFFDKRLSINNSVSCATCHKPELAFTDGEVKSKGVFGRKALRNAPSLLNIKDSPFFMFDGAVPTLEMQAIIPIQDHNEMGFNMGLLVKRLAKDSLYASKSLKVFNRKLDAYVITRSLAAFQRTLVSNHSRIDHFIKTKDKSTLTESEYNGWLLFSEKFDCISCHSLPNFTSYHLEKNYLSQITSSDLGRFRISGDSADIGKFKIPSLLNVGITSPYMHDGSFETLEKVLGAYQNNRNAFANQKMQQFVPTSEEKRALISFLHALTDRKSLKLKQ